jgi:hypothetical protein
MAVARKRIRSMASLIREWLDLDALAAVDAHAHAQP